MLNVDQVDSLLEPYFSAVSDHIKRCGSGTGLRPEAISIFA